MLSVDISKSRNHHLIKRLASKKTCWGREVHLGKTIHKKSEIEKKRPERSFEQNLYIFKYYRIVSKITTHFKKYSETLCIVDISSWNSSPNDYYFSSWTGRRGGGNSSVRGHKVPHGGSGMQPLFNYNYNYFSAFAIGTVNLISFEKHAFRTNHVFVGRSKPDTLF